MNDRLIEIANLLNRGQSLDDIKKIVKHENPYKWISKKYGKKVFAPLTLMPIALASGSYSTYKGLKNLYNENGDFRNKVDTVKNGITNFNKNTMKPFLFA